MDVKELKKLFQTVQIAEYVDDDQKKLMDALGYKEEDIIQNKDTLFFHKYMLEKKMNPLGLGNEADSTEYASEVMNVQMLFALGTIRRDDYMKSTQQTQKENMNVLNFIKEKVEISRQQQREEELRKEQEDKERKREKEREKDKDKT